MSISGAHIRACLLGWTIPTIVWAGVEPVADATGDGFGELPVVLTASRLRQSVNQAPSSVTVIDREMIEKSGARHIADLMRFVPGAIVGYEDGNRPVVTLRGMAGVFVPGLQVLIDGVSVYSPIWGGMQWEELPIALSDIDRIEVIRGPNAALFGPNSFLGVINIITREPAADSGTRLEGNAGARGIADGTVRYASSDGAWRYRMTLGQRASNGFGARPDFQRYLFWKRESGIQAGRNRRGSTPCPLGRQQKGCRRLRDKHRLQSVSASDHRSSSQFPVALDTVGIGG